MASCIETWLYDQTTRRWTQILPFLLGILYFLSADETIKYLPLDDNIKTHIQELSIYLSIPLLIIIAIVQILQHKQIEKIGSLQKELEKVSELESENARLDENISNIIQDMEYICNGYLYSLAKGPLEFFKSIESHERITIYLHDEKGHFYSIGRYSSNPEYGSKSREIYPSGQGNIAIAWENQMHFANDYPDPVSDPKGYSERCLRDGISEEIQKRIRMKSRLYFGYRVSKGIKSIAVIIIESTHPDRYDYKQLQEIFDKEKQYLCYLIDSLSKWMPNMDEARKKGF